ncbi:MAG: CIA30 family protein [Rhizobiales bacterium]|nr:CIA30 family protein [Hyphomicrobiales bacterium]MBO6697312.1 CIA30 family protein [Hyphomicrobiales bacterium]MBO6736433.1 CIA30 family protein [Hyphomicrobiales bacterium]MBO6912903.1 CIA30 family protein [Hyphomicrobiales bacterium]MBO6954071.1 CIA30 family protein [Hyphomicrobiales bacterium]
MIIDDLSRPAPQASNGATWQFIADGVMGGVSQGTMTRETVDGREAYRIRGAVSLENNGGFIQVALDLTPDGSAVDASAFSGIALDVTGNGETYNLHLRTTDLTRPWQSYRQSLIAGPSWETHRVPFTDFAPHRIDTPMDVSKLRRLGILAIGRAVDADVSVGGVRFY